MSPTPPTPSFSPATVSLDANKVFFSDFDSSIIQHYADVIMSAIAYQIIGAPSVCSILIQAQIKENIKALRKWPFGGESIGDRWFPSQRASDAEKVSI